MVRAVDRDVLLRDARKEVARARDAFEVGVALKTFAQRVALTPGCSEGWLTTVDHAAESMPGLPLPTAMARVYRLLQERKVWR